MEQQQTTMEALWAFSENNPARKFSQFAIVNVFGLFDKTNWEGRSKGK